MRRKATVLVGVALVLLAIECISEGLSRAGWTQWQRPLHWNYVHHAWLLVVPFLAMRILRRSPADYGLASNDPRREWRHGLALIVLMFPVPVAVSALFGTLTPVRPGLTFIVSTVVFQTVCAGFGEEFFFRGFMQGELNRVLARRCSFGRTPFGWGLVLTAAVFGFLHVIDSGRFNPLQGQFDWEELGHGINAGIGGVFVADVRVEKEDHAARELRKLPYCCSNATARRTSTGRTPKCSATSRGSRSFARKARASTRPVYLYLTTPACAETRQASRPASPVFLMETVPGVRSG